MMGLLRRGEDTRPLARWNPRKSSVPAKVHVYPEGADGAKAHFKALEVGELPHTRYLVETSLDGVFRRIEGEGATKLSARAI